MLKDSIVIVDYGTGNISAIKRSLTRIGVNSIISNCKNIIEKADKIILPGVGNYKNAMDQLIKLDLIETLYKFVIQEKKPVLGICLGMQLMAKKSEEGNCEGLGWINSEVIKFKTSNFVTEKIPQIGYNKLITNLDNDFLKGITLNDEFYFVHSYYLTISDKKVEQILTHYIVDFPSIIILENIYGVQFHPEKSSDSGDRILLNFATL